MVDAAHDRAAIGETDSQSLAGRVAVYVDDGLEAQGPGRRILGQNVIAGLNGFDRQGSGQGLDRCAGGEAGPDRRRRILRHDILFEMSVWKRTDNL